MIIANSIGTLIKDFNSWRSAFVEVDRESHWRDGRSACALAYNFTHPSVDKSEGKAVILRMLDDLGFKDVNLRRAEIEHESRFDGFKGSGRMQDMTIWADTNSGPVSVNIEAKVDEAFGDTIQTAYERALEKYGETYGRSRAKQRIENLVRLLFPSKRIIDVLSLRYQLLYYLAGSVKEAKKIGGIALLPVIVYKTDKYDDIKGKENHDDYISFMDALGFESFEINGLRYYKGVIDGVEVYSVYLIVNQ